MCDILITGAAGYIGSNMINVLLKEGYNVHAIVRPSSNLSKIAGFGKGLSIHTCKGETGELVKLVGNIKPYAVFHFASVFISEHNPDDIRSIIENNILFGAQMLEAAVKSNVLYFINTGTHWQNYNGEAYNPVNLYAASKQAFECLARYYLEISEMRMLTVRLVDTYGPFDTRPKVMQLFKRIAKSGETLEMSPGGQKLGLVYIDDVMKAFLLAFELIREMKPHEQVACQLAPKRFYELREVARIFEEVSGLPLNILWGKRAYRQREIMENTTYGFNIADRLEMTGLPEGILMMLEKERNA